MSKKYQYPGLPTQNVTALVVTISVLLGSDVKILKSWKSLSESEGPYINLKSTEQFFSESADKLEKELCKERSETQRKENRTTWKQDNRENYYVQC